MPRQAAQPAKPRKYCRTEFHPVAEAYLKDLADDVGEEVGYIIRLCVAKSLPEIEAALRSGERPADEMKKPTKALKTTLRKPKPIPEVSQEPAPPILTFLETGEMPAELQTPPEEACEPSLSPDPSEGRQEAERPAEPAAPPASPPTVDPSGSSPTPSLDPLQRKIEQARLRRRRG